MDAFGQSHGYSHYIFLGIRPTLNAIISLLIIYFMRSCQSQGLYRPLKVKAK